MTSEPELFEIEDDGAWKDYLDEYGYVVINDVLTKEKYYDVYEQFVRDWLHVSPDFSFDDKDTWTLDKCPMWWEKGMVYSHGFGQSDFQWMLRTDKNIVNIWERLHNTTELVVSYDGFSVFLSGEQDPGMWLHVDQHHKDLNYSVQGAYNLKEVGEKDAGFIVVPGSHKSFKPDTECGREFLIVDEDDPHVEKAVKLLIPPNCFILWNSKTIHASVGMDESKGLELNRVTSYICYFPKADRSEEVYGERIYGYYDGDNCSHYATRHDPKPQMYGFNSFMTLKPSLNDSEEVSEDIPKERLALI
jgi:hypothetical protein